MPWITPTLRKVREMVRDDITASLFGASFIGNNPFRIMADAMAGLAHHVLEYIDWLALQLMPDTAEQEWLDRHGDIWLVNADGTVGRKMATYASGHVNLVGIVSGIVIPVGTGLESSEVAYETTALAVTADAGVPVGVPIRALDAGAAGNLDAGLVISLNPPIINVEGSAEVVDLTGGTDIENDDDLRVRVLLRIRQPPMGGSQKDYVQWALAVPGVTRAWCEPLAMGMGTVTVRFLMDELRADDDGWPTYSDILAVTAYLETVRPVAVKDFWVVAPIKQRIDFVISGLTPDTEEIRAQVETSIRAMLRDKAAPGQTIYSAWKSYAVMNAPGVESFRLVNDLNDVMESSGHMAVLGDIFYGN